MLHRSITFLFSAIFALILVSACAPDGPNAKDNGNNDTNVETGTETSTQAPTTANDALSGENPMQVVDDNGEVVFHYVCPNACEGSGGPGQAPCPICGATYVHNDRYHQFQQQSFQQQQQIETEQLPAKNTEGVYHWVCPQGCEGGSSVRGNCSICGAELAHNDAFHNN